LVQNISGLVNGYTFYSCSTKVNSDDWHKIECLGYLPEIAKVRNAMEYWYIFRQAAKTRPLHQVPSDTEASISSHSG
jgi:hypothetical protein